MKPAYAEANSGKPEPVLRAVVKRADKWFETAVFWPSTHPESRYAMTGYIDLGWVTDACDAALHRALGFTHARLPRPKRRPRTTVQLHQTKCAHPRLNLQPYKRRHVNRIAARFLAGGTTAQRGCRACALCANDTSEAFYGRDADFGDDPH